MWVQRKPDYQRRYAHRNDERHQKQAQHRTKAKATGNPSPKPATRGPFLRRQWSTPPDVLHGGCLINLEKRCLDT